MMLSFVLDPRYIDYLSEGYDLSTNLVTVASWMKNYAIPFAESRQLIYQLIVYYTQARQKILLPTVSTTANINTPYTHGAVHGGMPATYPMTTSALPDHALVPTGFQPVAASSTATAAGSNTPSLGIHDVKAYWDKISTRENDRLSYLVKLLLSIVPYMSTSIRTMTLERKLSNPVNDQISISTTFHHLHALAIHYADFRYVC
jgi:hypothetical protein